MLIVGYHNFKVRFAIELKLMMTEEKENDKQTILPSFSHGQEYVALSRTSDVSKIVMSYTPDQLCGGNTTIKNIVYPQLLIDTKTKSNDNGHQSANT